MKQIKTLIKMIAQPGKGEYAVFVNNSWMELIKYVLSMRWKYFDNCS